MNIEEIVNCHPDGPSTSLIRTLVCKLATDSHAAIYNPLIDTEFNKLLSEITQDAFDAGRRYERQNLKSQ